MKIKKGSKVNWASSGRGSRHKKAGVVMRFLDKGQDVRSFLPKKTPVSKIMTRHYKSTHLRFLVKVEDKRLGTVYYTPRVVTINEQNGGIAKQAKRR